MTVHVSVLGGSVIVTNGDVRRSPARKADRVYALILLLAWARGDGMTVAQLTDLLWGRQAEGTLRKTVQRARQLLGSGEAIINLRGGYMLNEDLVACDLWELEDEALTLIGGDDQETLTAWAERASAASPPSGLNRERLRERAQLLLLLVTSDRTRRLLTALD